MAGILLFLGARKASRRPDRRPDRTGSRREQSPAQATVSGVLSQTASLVEFAQNHDLEVPKEWVFEDEGYIGATLDRPGLERVRDLAAEGQCGYAFARTSTRTSARKIHYYKCIGSDGWRNIFLML